MLGDESRIDLEKEPLIKGPPVATEQELTEKELPSPPPSPISEQKKSKKMFTLKSALILQKFKGLQQRIHDLHHKPVHPHEVTAFATEHSLHAQTFEQLQRLIDKKMVQESEKRKLMRFVDDVLYEGDRQALIEKHGDGGKITTLLGKVLFLVDQQLIPAKWKAQSIDRIFQEAIEKIKQTLPLPKKEEAAREELELKRQTALPVEIGKLLILSDGSLNSGLIPELNKNFVNLEEETLNYAQSLKSGLQLIHQSSKFKELIESLNPNISPQGAAIVRKTLHLSDNAPVTKRDSLICLLSAFLTHLRQGQSGSCFATFIAIEQQKMRPEETMKDLIQLLEKGSLIRIVDDKEQSFPYMIDSLDEETPSHPLLRAWENSIAGMAEAESGGLLNSALFRSIAYLFRKQRNMMPCLGSQHAVEMKLLEILKNDTRYLYNSRSRSTPADTHSGAFVLHKVAEGKFIPIEDGHAFFNLVIDIVEKIAPQCTALLRGNEEALLFKLLKKYHPNNWGVTHSRHSIELLKYTPWKTCTGNSPKLSLKVYFSMQEDPKILEWKSYDAKELAENLLTFRATASQELIPVKISCQHAFSLLPHHPSIENLIHFETLQAQADKFKKLPLTKSMRHKILQELSSTMLTRDQCALFLEKMSKANLKTSLHHYRELLSVNLFDFLKSEEDLHSLQKKIDLVIFKALPLLIRKEIEHSIAVIGDSNWQIGTHDINYGIGINPASGKIELLSVLDDGTLYKFLTQSTYLQNHTWEVYCQ